jgi:hypothetical protein
MPWVWSSMLGTDCAAAGAETLARRTMAAVRR